MKEFNWKVTVNNNIFKMTHNGRVMSEGELDEYMSPKKVINIMTEIFDKDELEKVHCLIKDRGDFNDSKNYEIDFKTVLSDESAARIEKQFSSVCNESEDKESHTCRCRHEANTNKDKLIETLKNEVSTLKTENSNLRYDLKLTIAEQDRLRSELNHIKGFLNEQSKYKEWENLDKNVTSRIFNNFYLAFITTYKKNKAEVIQDLDKLSIQLNCSQDLIRYMLTHLDEFKNKFGVTDNVNSDDPVVPPSAQKMKVKGKKSRSKKTSEDEIEMKNKKEKVLQEISDLLSTVIE